MWPPEQLDKIRIDPLRGTGACKPAPWPTDVNGRLTWNEPTSIAIVWLVLMGSLFLIVAWSMWGIVQLASGGRTFDVIALAAPCLIGLFLWFRAIQRLLTRRTVIIDHGLATCTVQTRTPTSHTDETHALSKVHIAVVTASSASIWRVNLSFSRTSWRYVALITPTGAFVLEAHWDRKVLRSKAQDLALQLGVNQKDAEADNLDNRLPLYFNAPY